MTEAERRALTAELRRVRDAIDTLYWTFTRTARGKPPFLVRPDLYARRQAIETELQRAALEKRTAPR